MLPERKSLLHSAAHLDNADETVGPALSTLKYLLPADVLRRFHSSSCVRRPKQLSLLSGYSSVNVCGIVLLLISVHSLGYYIELK